MYHRLLPLLLILSAIAALAQNAEDNGPAIVSRGVDPAYGAGSGQVQIRPYVGVSGVYDTALTPVSITPEGEVPEKDGYGAEVDFGAKGYHSWRNTVLGLDYRGAVHHYTDASYYDGTDQAINLGLTHKVSPNVSFSLREAAGTLSHGSTMSTGADYTGVETPQNEMFENRTHYLTSMGDLKLTKGGRLSFNLGGSGTIVRRRSESLSSMSGWSGRGDVAYRIGRRHTIGFDYSYDHYEYTQGRGNSDIHSVALDWSSRFGRSWELGLRAGGARVETMGTTQIALDPILAILLGQSSLTLQYYNRNYTPSADARLTREFRRARLSFGYHRGTASGNDLYMTSREESGTAGFTYTALRKWHFSLSGDYTTYHSYGQNLGMYQSYRGGGGVTYQLASAWHLTARFDTRRYDVNDARFKRLQHRVSLGIAFSPGEFPLSLW
ncbi:MAG: hypothetical protein ABFD60_13045 [Bryobacteraceae bacterium]